MEGVLLQIYFNNEKLNLQITCRKSTSLVLCSYTRKRPYLWPLQPAPPATIQDTMHNKYNKNGILLHWVARCAANAWLLSLQLSRQLIEIKQSYIYWEGKIQQMVQDLTYGVTTYIVAACLLIHAFPSVNFSSLLSPLTGQPLGKLDVQQRNAHADHKRIIDVADKSRQYPIWQRNQARAIIPDPRQHTWWSSQVSVHIRVIFVPLQVIPCDKILNPLLYCLEVRLQREEQLLSYELIIRKLNKQVTWFMNTPLNIYTNLYCTKQKDYGAGQRWC